MAQDAIDHIIALYKERIGLKEDVFKKSTWSHYVAERMAVLGIDDEQAYCKKLMRSSAEFSALLESVVVPETWFFRESAALDYIVQKVASAKAPMSILDVACSTGEEPYSLAMLLHSANIPPANYSIDAVDVSPSAIASAERGVYRPNAFRGKSSAYKGRFFKQSGLLYELNDVIKQSVHFFVGNILDPASLRGHGSYHIVLCRNLFIYLSMEAQADALKILKGLMTPDGILIVGATEGEIVRRNGWEQIESPAFCAFVVGKAAPTKARAPAKMPLRKPARSNSLLPPAGSSSLLEKASQLADQGLYEEALAVCLKYTKGEGAVDPAAYFLMGVIEHARERMGLAEACFAKAIYLRPEYVEALTYLTLLAEQRGDAKQVDIYRQRIARIGGRNE